MKTPKYSDLHRYLRGYTPVRKQGDGYLQRKFARIRAELREKEQSKVVPLKEKRK